MGVLDDAIREHLELKRQHGAPDADVRKAEQEALGPARLDQAAPPVEAPVEADPEPVPQAPQGYAPFDVDAPTEHLVLDEPAAAVPDPTVEDIEPPAVDDDDENIQEDDGAPLGPGTGIVADATLEADPAVEDPIDTLDDFEDDEDDELAEGEGQPALADEEEPVEEGTEEETEDVLEDTPEFLQETPEHDRLWFEQKPPRDFDFND